MDVIGAVPGIGTIANGINTAWYAAEGDYASAALSATSMIPGVGAVVKGSALAVKTVGLAAKAVPKIAAVATKVAPKIAAAASKAAPKVASVVASAAPAVVSGTKKAAGNAKALANSMKRIATSSLDQIKESTARTVSTTLNIFSPKSVLATESSGMLKAASNASSDRLSLKQFSSPKSAKTGVSKTPKKTSKRSGKERATDRPSWAIGEYPALGEAPNDFASRVMTEKYGEGGFSKTSSEYSQLKKWASRGYGQR